VTGTVSVEGVATAAGGPIPPPPGLPGPEEVLGQAGDENFPVASRVLGARVRRSLFAIYGFARFVDDVGDEAAGDRGELLDWVDAEIDRMYAGAESAHPVIRRIAATAREEGIPPEPLHRLVEANRRDQIVRSYATFEDLLGYCELSANPVGHMVLCVFGAATADRLELADSVCSGLQVTEHLQDVREDLARGRRYLPQADLDRFGCREEDLRTTPSPEPVRALIAFEVERARELLDRGAPLARRLPLRPALAVAAFAAGGHAALGAIERSGYAIGDRPPVPSAAARLAATLRTARAAIAR
jgi:squalene synthase HpnC